MTAQDCLVQNHQEDAYLTVHAVLVATGLVPAEADASPDAARDGVEADDGVTGAAVDTGAIRILLVGAVVGLDDSVHRPLLDGHTLVRLGLSSYKKIQIEDSTFSS